MYKQRKCTIYLQRYQANNLIRLMRVLSTTCTIDSTVPLNYNSLKCQMKSTSIEVPNICVYTACTAKVIKEETPCNVLQFKVWLKVNL